MDERGAVRVALELLPGEPIKGRIQCEDAPAQNFHGWLELASKLERLRVEGGEARADDG